MGQRKKTVGFRRFRTTPLGLAPEREPLRRATAPAPNLPACWPFHSDPQRTRHEERYWSTQRGSEQPTGWQAVDTKNDHRAGRGAFHPQAQEQDTRLANLHIHQCPGGPSSTSSDLQLCTILYARPAPCLSYKGWPCTIYPWPAPAHLTRTPTHMHTYCRKPMGRGSLDVLNVRPLMSYFPSQGLKYHLR